MMGFFHKVHKVESLEDSAKAIRADLELAVRELYAAAAEQRAAASQLQEVAASRLTRTPL